MGKRYRFQGIFIFIVIVSSAASLLAQKSSPPPGSRYFSDAEIRLDKSGRSPAALRFKEGNRPALAAFFDEYRKSFLFSLDNEMRLASTLPDRLGQSHYRFNQYYKGIQVLGGQYILHESGGYIHYANGRLIHGLDMGVTPALSEQAAMSAALNAVGAEIYMWESKANEDFIKREQDNPNATFYPRGELKITSGWEELLGENCKLVYRFDIYAEKPLGRYWVDVDAVSGEVLNIISRIHDSDVPGSGASLYNGTVNITVDQTAPSSFRLQGNTTRGAAIRTFDMNNGTNYNTATNFTASNANGPWDEGGVSGHFGAEVTYDYYFNEHGRNSLDDAGFTLLSYVHYSSGYNNAFWDGLRMTYGDGDGLNFTPLISLDVVAHELTHGVTEFSADLVYQKEPGALNESFSDIFGNLVEFEVEGIPGVGTGNWRVGEDITTSSLGIRNMANPNEFGDPDTYGGTNWVNQVGCVPTQFNDYCGVHTNSGVQNFWFYLLMQGGSGTNDNGDPYNVTGIGAADAAAIAYRNLTVYLASGSEYIDARNGSIDAATDLFGDPSQQLQSVKDAWDAVGVYGPPDPPEIDVFPASLSFIVPPDGNDAAVLTISNTAAAGAQNLIWSIAEQEAVLALDNGRQLPVQVQELPALPEADFGAQELSLSSSDVSGNFEDLFTAQYPTPGHSSAEAVPVVPLALESAVSLVLDDGSRENAVGLMAGGQFIWLNRFTPNPADFPFTLQEIRILFPDESGISVGQLVDIYIYEDTDGDGNPGTGETFLAAYNNAAVQAVDDVTFSVYPISPLVLNGPNDVLIAVVNRTAGIAAGTFVAAIDQTASAGRSWVGTYAGNPGNPPTLPATGLWGIIDSFGLPGNWMIRGYGITGTGCPWLSENPASGTSVPTGNQQVIVSVDATGLTPGTYNCDLIISSNDPDENPVTVPVQLTVTGGLEVNVKAYLEGPYNSGSGSMDTYLRDNGLLPTSQPFGGPPWNYGGAESVGSVPAGVVDWVLLELRNSPGGSVLSTGAAFIRNDGLIVDLDGSSPVNFLYPPGNYHVVVRHRNHLDIMSIAPFALSQSSSLYDFTTPDGQAYGTDPMKDLGGGVYGMFAGDGDANGSVTTADRVDVWRPQNGTDWDYAKFGDFNLDGDIDASDLNEFWRVNENEASGVPAIALRQPLHSNIKKPEEERRNVR